MDNAVEMRHVCVRRGGREILNRVSWSVDEGQRWVVFGPNGAGKTTLIRLLAGRMCPDEGKIGVLGEDLGQTDPAQIRSLVGLSSADRDAKFPSPMSVLDAVRTAAYGVSVSFRESYAAQDDSRAMRLLADLGISHLARRTFSSLSSGEKKRVGIARALMPNPEILILDEPAAGLDLGGREQLLRSLEELARSQSAPVMVLVTHHAEEIPPGFTHALLLRGGQVFACGPLESVFTSERISSLFGMDLEISRHGGRFSVSARNTENMPGR